MSVSDCLFLKAASASFNHGKRNLFVIVLVSFVSEISGSFKKCGLIVAVL